MAIESIDQLRLVSNQQNTFRIRPPNRTRPITPIVDRTHRTYQSKWDQIYHQITSVVIELQHHLLDQLITFIHLTPHPPPSLIPKPIPTALLIGSSRILNQAIAHRIRSSSSSSSSDSIPRSIPIPLSSRSCSNFSLTIRSIVKTLELNLSSPPSSPTTTKKSNLTLSRDDVDCIRSLYRTISRDSKPRLVFIIDDFEAFDPLLFQHLVLVLGGLSQTIPLIIVLSLSTSLDALHSLLHRTLIVRLQVTPFTVQMADRGVNSIIYNLVFNPEMGFDISANVIRSIMTSSDHLNHSIDQLVSKIQFIHLAFYHTNPLIEFFEAIDPAQHHHHQDLDEILDRIRANGLDLDFLSSQLSLTSSWRSLRSDDQDPFDDGSDRSRLGYRKMFERLYESYPLRSQIVRSRALAFEVLKSLGSNWTEKQRTEEWLLFHLDHPQLLSYCHELCKLLLHCNDELTLTLLKNLSPQIENLEEHDEIRETVRDLRTVIEVGQRGEGRQHLINQHLPQLLDMRIGLVSSDLEFSNLLKKLSELMWSFFKSRFGTGSGSGISGGLVLREAWTFDDERLLNEVFHPSYTQAIKTDLESSKSKDLRELYGLFKESNQSRRINLADWIGAWSRSGNDDELRTHEAKFMRAVGSFGLIGLVGVEKRRIEHVSRTFW